MEKTRDIPRVIKLIRDLFNASSDLISGKENKIINKSLDQTFNKYSVFQTKEELREFLEEFKKEDLDQDEKSIVEFFYRSFFANMWNDPGYRPQLEAIESQRSIRIESYLEEIINKLDSNISGLSQSDKESIDILKRKIECVLVVGSAYTEHTLQLNGDMILGEKQGATINNFYGGSGINYILRLIENGVTTIPILNVGNDESGEAIRSEILECAQRAEFSSNLLELIESDDFCCKYLETTPRSYIIIEKNKKRRTIINDKFGGSNLFQTHIREQIRKISEFSDLDINVVVIGHIPEQETDKSKAPCTEYLIDKFKDKSIILANFGDSQIKLGSKFWEDKLQDIDIFQLNLHEIRKFFSDQDRNMPLVDIIDWLREKSITTVITLERFGAIGTYKNEKGIFLVPPFKIDSYLDSTGAGDAMGAGIVSKLYHKKEFSSGDFLDSLSEARIWAAHACTILGGAYRCSDTSRFHNFEEKLKAKGLPSIERMGFDKARSILEIYDLIDEYER